MKECPICKTTYTDNSLSFCLNDGAALTVAPSSSSEITQQMSFASTPTLENNSPIRVNIQSESPTQSSFPMNTAQTARKSISPLIVLSIMGLLLVVGVAGLAAAYFAFIRPNNSATVNSSPTPPANLTESPVKNSTPDETQALKDKLEKLEKRLSEQKNTKNNPSISNTPNSQPASPQGTITARVNSPGDGFLSLRTEPSVKTGVQRIKIPTGALVQLEDCQRNYLTIDSRRGRWCMVSYNGQTGWVFDAWLIY